MCRCGGAVGLYFLVKRCALLYLYAGNGTFAQAPYLDVHGEIDTLIRSVLLSAIVCYYTHVQLVFCLGVGADNIYIPLDGKKSGRPG